MIQRARRRASACVLTGAQVFTAAGPLPKMFKSFFIERIPDGEAAKAWHGHAYFDWLTAERVTVIYPLHWIVQLSKWLRYRWDRHRLKRSWIDRQIAAASGRTK